MQAAGYDQCPAYGWLKVNGSREARFEAQTVIMENSDAVYEAIRNVQLGWARNEFGMVLQAAPNTEAVQAAPSSEVPMSQSSTQPDNNQMTLG